MISFNQMELFLVLLDSLSSGFSLLALELVNQSVKTLVAEGVAFQEPPCESRRARARGNRAGDTHAVSERENRDRQE